MMIDADPQILLAPSSAMSIFKLKLFFKVLIMTLLHSDIKKVLVFSFLACLNKVILLFYMYL